MLMVDIVSIGRSSRSLNWVWPALVAAAVIGTFVPTFVDLASGPWQSEQEGHGPLILAASLWLAWSNRARFFATLSEPAPQIGWPVLLAGLATLFIGRTQDLISVETLSILPVISGCILILYGVNALKVFVFPILFLIFVVPAPGWIVDGATVPLKVWISDWVTKLLYFAGYPIAQNGVVIMIGPYQLLMKDACAGMNSIFALSAIGMFYVYSFRWQSKVRSIVLLLSVIPITILANFFRVLTLVLIAYYGGVELIDGILHDLTGIILFVIALLLLFAADGLLGLFARLSFRPRRTV